MHIMFSTLTAWLLSDITTDKDVYFILSFLGGILGLALFYLGMVVCKIKPSQSAGIIIFCITLLITIFIRQSLNILMSPNLVGIAMFFLFILLLRLIFIQDLLVPPYSDSLQHVLIVKDFINPLSPPQAFYNISTDSGHYYHFGFHALAAWLSGSTFTSPEQTIMILGQYFQALAVLAVYPLAHVISKNKILAWIAMIIAGLYIPIPAYASNWGKYPAIASLTGITFVLTLLITIHKSYNVVPRKFWLILGLATFSTTLIHSRSIFVLTLASILLILYTYTAIDAIKFKPNTENVETIITAAILLTALLFISIYILEIQVSLLFLFFLLISTLVSFYANFLSTAALIIFTLIMVVGFIIPQPLSFLPSRFSSLFDRPFLVILFYLPASYLITSGLNGGGQLFIKSNLRLWQRFTFVIVLSLGMFNAIFIQSHSPSECCVFMNDDDLFAFEWIKLNLPNDAIIGIASTGKEGNFSPSDGGAWVEVFTDISTHKLDSKKNFLGTKWKLCKDNIEYLYVDNLENSFDEYNLIEAGAIRQFNLGTVSIYHLECDFLR